ncbi:hypothetical protein A4A49_10326 [Nicotiana attenuata]|uniref:Uncharacterized protein n=1 Tax=Nicotiana attenuata TaxID=49451 RepID=A0A314LBC8_NICAT|nr:hypothetical protein A4A49_10326 [Nicotiana attenuata]
MNLVILTPTHLAIIMKYADLGEIVCAHLLAERFTENELPYRNLVQKFSSTFRKMLAKSDFAQKLLHDLKFCNERMAAAQYSSYSYLEESNVCHPGIHIV